MDENFSDIAIKYYIDYNLKYITNNGSYNIL